MAPRPVHHHCGNCIFFKVTFETLGEGLCRRYPPRIVDGQIKQALSLIHWAAASAANIETRQTDQAQIDPDVDSDQYPTVWSGADGDWCGEFRREWPV